MPHVQALHIRNGKECKAHSKKKRLGGNIRRLTKKVDLDER